MIRIKSGSGSPGLPGDACRLVGTRRRRRLVAWQPEPQGRFEVIGLVAEHRRPRLAVDQEDPIGKPGLEGQPAAVVEREVVAAGDLDEPVVQDRAPRRALQIGRAGGNGLSIDTALSIGGSALERQADAYVASGKDAGIEDAGRDGHGLARPQLGLFGHARPRRRGSFVSGRPTSISSTSALGRKAVGKGRADAAALKVGEEKHLPLQPPRRDDDVARPAQCLGVIGARQARADRGIDLCFRGRGDLVGIEIREADRWTRRAAPAIKLGRLPLGLVKGRGSRGSRPPCSPSDRSGSTTSRSLPSVSGALQKGRANNRASNKHAGGPQGQ